MTRFRVTRRFRLQVSPPYPRSTREVLPGLRHGVRGRREVLPARRADPQVREPVRRPHRPGHRRSLSRDQEARRRGDGRRLPGRAREDGTEERHQGDERVDVAGRRCRVPLQPRGQQRLPDPAPQHLCHLRLRGDPRRVDVPRDGVHRGALPERDPQEVGADDAAARHPYPAADRRGAARRARRGDRPPRPEARQHHDRPAGGEGSGEGRGLRHREGGGGRRVGAKGHQDRVGRGDAGVHEPGAAFGGQARRPLRPLFAGAGLLPDDHRHPPLPGGDEPGDDDQAADGRSDAAPSGAPDRELPRRAPGGDGPRAGALRQRPLQRRGGVRQGRRGLAGRDRARGRGHDGGRRRRHEDDGRRTAAEDADLERVG